MVEQWNGRPQNPERDGWHWVHFGHLGSPDYAAPVACLWEDGGWIVPLVEDAILPDDLVRILGNAERAAKYLGPCLTPAEVAERVAEAIQTERAAQAEAMIVTEAARIEADAKMLDARVAAARIEGAIVGAGDLEAAWRERDEAQRLVNEACGERDEAIATLTLYRAEHGCTRGQRTTQWCGEAARLRRAWLRVIQAENQCPATGGGCLANRCGCVEEMKMLVSEAEPGHDR